MVCSVDRAFPHFGGNWRGGRVKKRKINNEYDCEGAHREGQRAEGREEWMEAKRIDLFINYIYIYTYLLTIILL